MLVLLYLMTYLGKTNIGNTNIEGLLDSLHMRGAEYNIALSVFSIPFVLAEVPSNMNLHMSNRPSLYIEAIVTCWGIAMLEVNFWNVASTPSPTKRGISIGFILVCVGNIGGLISSYVYLQKEAPRYPTGYSISFRFVSAGIIAAITLELTLRD
ncbi:putative transporter [Colletotrichum sidae]|uniref:Putative transporter n=1 Tax=Colletotrichum sidae TaxID=1347389 RepID=A0A4V3HSR8_9PEZI|nr:putative transporter [Colletotrichum sidae]